MAVDVLDFAKSVESDRKRLVNIVKKHNPTVNQNAPLSEVVTKVSSLISEPSNLDTTKHRVRWININGDIIRTDYVDDGVSVIPPDPDTFNCDPDYLEFDYWTTTSDITNVQKDIDCGTIYKTKADDENKRWTYLFIHLPDDGVTITIPFSKGSQLTDFYIDWGDGSAIESPVDVASGTLSHTYTNAGNYVIKCWCSYLNWFFNTSSSTYLLGSQALNKYIYKLFYGENIIPSQYNFNYCSYLNYISLSNNFPTSMPSGFLNKCPIIALILPTTITKISSSCFYESYGLTQLVLPQNISITSSSLLAHTYLDDVILPDGLTSIYSQLFYNSSGGGNSRLRRIFIPKSVTSIGSSAFNGNTALCDIRFEKNSTLKTIGDRAFASCNALRELILPTSVTTISGQYTFMYAGVTKFNSEELVNWVNATNGPIFENMKIKTLTILPTLVNFYNTTFIHLKYLEELILYNDFDLNISLNGMWRLSDNCLINIADWLKDNSGNSDIVRTIGFTSCLIHKLNDIRINTSGERSYDKENSKSLVEVIQDKNWTISWTN